MKTPAAFLALLVVVCPSVLFAQWPLDGMGIGTATNNQNLPRAVPDGSGGAIVVWEDNRTGSYAVYAQRINALGDPQWTPGGVQLANPQSDNTPQLIPDGAGGAIIAWFRNQDIYAQRVDNLGTKLWGANGVAVSAHAFGQSSPVLVSDNAGGAIVAWQDLRNGVDSDVYARRINGAGVPQWAVDGVAVSATTGNQGEPQIAADGSGGAVITWTDWRAGFGDIYVQRVNSSGTMLWTANGVALCTAANVQSDPAIVGDGTGGAIVAWEDTRVDYDLYARRVNSSGTPQWTANGVALSALADWQWNPAILSDGLGGAIIAWEDRRTAGIPDIYVQRLNSAGTAQWTANGVALATIGSGQEPSMISDGLGGAIVAWQDARSGTLDIYARRINASGAPQWSAHGVALCTAPGGQDATAITSDGAGGAIVFWEDLRSGANDVYAQRIERNGHWGYPAPGIVQVSDIPGDQGGQINLSWDASRLDLWPDELIDTYTVWRALDPAAAVAAIEAGAAVVRDGVDPAGGRDEHTIRVQDINQATFYWSLIHTVGAYGLSGYSDVVPTLFDSTAASPDAHFFQVIAHAAVGQWISEPASGRSLDNLAPLAPLQLTAQRVGPDVHLVWNRNLEADLDHYAVYRHTSTGVTPTPIYFLSAPPDSELVDASAPATGLYYIVTAVDAHDNQGPPSNEAAVSPVTGVNDTPAVTRFTVLTYPNPFAESTELHVGMPAAGAIAVDVFDVAGRRVRELNVARAGAGWQRVLFDGRGANGARLASGVYFCRVSANGSAITRKVVISR